MTPRSSPLLIKPDYTSSSFIKVDPEIAGWEHLHFQAIKLPPGKTWQFDTGDHELVLVVLGGCCRVSSNKGNWQNLGSRKDVFSGMPTALYLSINTQLTVFSGDGGVEFGAGWTKARAEYPPALVTPEDVTVELRGGENSSRQVNHIVPPGFPCDRLAVVEVYTPGGNWSSYPPHKHDQRILSADGKVLEADLEEVYFYKIDHPQSGFACQRIYTADGRLDELILVKNDHLVLSPEGYHPVAAAPGYDCYYLNFLAGTDQGMASSDDPDHSWVKATWKKIDPRLPLVHISMNKMLG